MDYTTSSANIVHMASGRRMHQQSAPITTAVSDIDMNQVVWSLMELVRAAGITPRMFNPDDSATYTVLKRAIDALYRNMDKQQVIDYGGVGNGSTDDLAAVLAAKAAGGGWVHFPRRNNAATVYYLGPITAGQLDGAAFSADDGVTISVATNVPYALFANVTYKSDVRVLFRDINSATTFPASAPMGKKSAPMLRPEAHRRSRTALTASSAFHVNARGLAAWPTSDTFNTLAPTTTTQTIQIPAGSLTFKGAFVDLGVYETVSAYFEDGITPGPVGVIIRGTAGFCVIYSNGTGNYFVATKLTGQAVSGNAASLAWNPLGQGSYNSFAAEASVWSMTRTASDRVIVKLNGKALTAPIAPQVGDVCEVGFVTYASSAFTVSGLTIERRTDAVIGAQMMDEIRVFGDSTAERFPGSWDQWIKPMLDGRYGIKIGAVTNYGVAGQTIEQQYAAMQTSGFGNAYYVVFCAGTNNAQGLQPIANYKAAVSQALGYIIGQGRRPLVVIPWMWYTRTQSVGGAGQMSSNYDKAAPYRMWLERIAFELGCVVVKTPEELPNPSPALMTSEPTAALLRDNIHQDALAHQLYAEVVVQALVDDYLGMPDAVEETPAAYLMMNGASAASDLRIAYGKDGFASIAGTIAVTTITNGTSLMRIPRYAMPIRLVNIPAMSVTSGGALGSCYVYADTATGTLRLQGAPAGTTSVILSGTAWLTAASV